MKTILVVDDMPIVRDAMAAAMRAAGYGVATACDGLDALTKVATNLPDLVLLDLGMPRLDGLGVLKALRGKAKTLELPVILLTANSDREKVLLAAKFGIQGYLLKSQFSLADLVARVRRQLADGFCGAPVKTSVTATPVQGNGTPPPSTGRPPGVPLRAVPDSSSVAVALTSVGSEHIPQLLTRDVCLSRIAKTMEGKTLSGIVTQVIAMAMSPRTDSAGLADMIARDPMLSARVLRLANSAGYAARSGPKTTIPDAVRAIGANTIRNVAATMGIFAAMPETSPDGYNPLRCWQHSFAVARLCEHFAGQDEDQAAGVAYLVGLCHDLGEVVFYAQFGREYSQVFDWQARTGRPSRELEKLMLGVERGELVGQILEHLGLPDAVRQPIEAYHNGSGGSRNKMAHLVRLADIHANAMQLASGPRAVISPIAVTEYRAATGKDRPELPDANATRSEVLSLTGMLAGLSTREEEAMMEPRFPRSDRAVCLVRESTISSCDPIETAIGTVAEVTPMDRLPTAAQLKDFHAVVVETTTSSAPGLGSRDLLRLKNQSGDDGLQLVWLVRKHDPTVSSPGIHVLPWHTTLETLSAVLGLAISQRQTQAA